MDNLQTCILAYPTCAHIPDKQYHADCHRLAHVKQFDLVFFGLFVCEIIEGLPWWSCEWSIDHVKIST